jgi:hypothetical protein
MSDRTRTQETEAEYADRFRLLFKKARIELGVSANATVTAFSFTILAFVNWLIAKRVEFTPATWRQYRSAVIFALEKKAEAEPKMAAMVASAVALLRAASPPGENGLPLRTSASKAKRFKERDLDRVCHLALSGRSPNAPALVHLLQATILAGCRPCEWPSATLRKSAAPGFAWELVVRNAKNTNNRSHGEIRTLRWQTLSPEHLYHLKIWLEIAQLPDYSKRQASLCSLLDDLTNKLFNRRALRPTIYSGRHEAIARWKAQYVNTAQTAEELAEGLAIVAALAGHGSDETATKHYGRPQKGQISCRYPSPCAEPIEVARVRKVFEVDRVLRHRIGKTARHQHE